jgi:two-component system sensor histidine kinase DesK
MSCPLGDGRKGAELALTEVALTLWMASFAKNIRLNAALRQARDELAQTAVLAERDRIARDLHDILGHSLTAITVKAALARQLLGRDPDQVRVEITDIERLARSALADVRATTSGIRERSLAGELAAARAVLTAAGITAVMPGAVDDVLPAGRELFAYVVKEAVTNVVRHSGASNS